MNYKEITAYEYERLLKNKNDIFSRPTSFLQKSSGKG